MDFAGETAPRDHRAENDTRLWDSDRPDPCTTLEVSDKSGVHGSEGSDSGLPFPGDKGQEEFGAGGVAKISCPSPCREPHSTQKITLSAGENRSETTSFRS